MARHYDRLRSTWEHDGNSTDAFIRLELCINYVVLTWAWLNTVVMLKHPGHFTSMKKLSHFNDHVVNEEGCVKKIKINLHTISEGQDTGGDARAQSR